MKKERSDRGFTLIEVLIALIVLTVGVAGVLSGLTTVTLASVHTNEQGRATALAVQKMEELKALPVADIEPQAAVKRLGRRVNVTDAGLTEPPPDMKSAGVLLG